MQWVNVVNFTKYPFVLPSLPFSLSPFLFSLFPSSFSPSFLPASPPSLSRGASPMCPPLFQARNAVLNREEVDKEKAPAFKSPHSGEKRQMLNKGENKTLFIAMSC